MYNGEVKEGFLPEIMRKQKDVKETGKRYFRQGIAMEESLGWGKVFLKI